MIPIPLSQKEYKIRGTSPAIICFLFFFRHTINLTIYERSHNYEAC